MRHARFAARASVPLRPVCMCRRPRFAGLPAAPRAPASSRARLCQCRTDWQRNNPIRSCPTQGPAPLPTACHAVRCGARRRVSKREGQGVVGTRQERAPREACRPRVDCARQGCSPLRLAGTRRLLPHPQRREHVLHVLLRVPRKPAWPRPGVGISKIPTAGHAPPGWATANRASPTHTTGRETATHPMASMLRLARSVMSAAGSRGGANLQSRLGTPPPQQPSPDGKTLRPSGAAAAACRQPNSCRATHTRGLPTSRQASQAGRPRFGCGSAAAVLSGWRLQVGEGGVSTLDAGRAGPGLSPPSPARVAYWWPKCRGW